MWPGKNVKVSDYIMFPIKLSSDSFKICYIYHTHQYVGDHKLIYFIFVCIFGYFFRIFTQRKLAREY